MKHLIFSKIICILLIPILIDVCTAQTPIITWQKCFGGSHDEAGYSVFQTSDGGYFISGELSSDDSYLGISLYNSVGISDGWILELIVLGIRCGLRIMVVQILRENSEFENLVNPKLPSVVTLIQRIMMFPDFMAL